MKKQGIINRELAGIFAKLGHTDQIVIADCGLPIPDGTTCIDLAFKLGEPGFIPVLEEVLKDLVVEQVFIAEEMKEANSDLNRYVHRCFNNIQKITHEELKIQSKAAKVIIRTGEASPYANIILQSGVIF